MFISPKELRLEDDVRDWLKSKCEIYETEHLNKLVGQLDVIYVTRLQAERYAKGKKELAKRYADYKITPSIMRKMKKDAIVLHPLPRNSEISTDVDKDPRAAYFRQAENGLYIRMALLELILEKRDTPAPGFSADPLHIPVHPFL